MEDGPRWMHAFQFYSSLTRVESAYQARAMVIMMMVMMVMVIMRMVLVMVIVSMVMILIIRLQNPWRPFL